MGSQTTPIQGETFVKTENYYKSPPSTGSDLSQPDTDDRRGRQPERERSLTAKGEEDSGQDEQDVKGGGAGKPRKRKRSRKGLEKNFACPHPGCGKRYSRAEHLYRHQLNHQPKKIYVCDHPGCERRFVRQDLCTRHKERHTARGSHLQRKDNALRGSDVGAAPVAIGQHEQPSHDASLDLRHNSMGLQVHTQYPANSNTYAYPGSEQREPSGATNMPEMAVHSPTSTLRRSQSEDQYYAQSPAAYDPATSMHKNSTPLGDLPARQSTSTSRRYARPQNGPQPDAFRSHPRLDITRSSGNYRPSSASSYDSLSTPRQGHHGFSEDVMASPQVYPQLSSLAPHTFNNAPITLPDPQSTFASAPSGMSSMAASGAYETYGPQSLPGMDTKMMDTGSNSYPVAYWNGTGYINSPDMGAEDLVNLLFSASPYPQSASPGGLRQSSISFGQSTFMEEDSRAFPFGYDTMNMHGSNVIPQQHPMALNNILDPASLHAMFSEEKRREVLKIIDERFNDHSPVSKQKFEIFSGDQDAEYHVLSLRQMQLYIRSYWYHFHPQMPIFHKPTFSANKAQNLLLIAVIAIGASCLDKMHGSDVTQAGADLANFLAWHLRGEVFKHKDFAPPAHLWIFQTLLLLEVYEKMYSTRTLHERAHIHHGTTLTLMRRGPSLIGRTPLDSPPSEKESAETNGDHQSVTSRTPEQWWNQWIENEATRRVAFAAFVIDSIHATMFGHQATMVAHEMKLALPCDESLWSAATSGEVAKKEADMRANGIKSMTFFEGLKNTLKGKSVQTNPFGRMAIMAGLLSVTWHMNQRDVQIHHLGALKALGGKDVWRGPLTKAFDSWKQDFDSGMGKGNISQSYSGSKFDDENIFESRVVLHHLSHMAMHVDIVSCQIFAGAERLLGRTTLQSDFEIAQKRIRLNWAPRACARHATFYAVRFLAQVLMADLAVSYNSPTGSNTYSARDDFLLNRPWVLYYATLVVWSYGYALDGPLKNPPDLSTPEAQAHDARQYLTKFGSIPAPQDLGNMSDRNACLGLLYILHEKFGKCRWQLLHEAAKLLDKCIMKLLDGSKNGELMMTDRG